MKSSKEKVAFEVNKSQLTKHMNNTKWNKLFNALFINKPEIQLKWLFEEDPYSWTKTYLVPSTNYFEVTSLGPIPYREIEWIRIKNIAMKDQLLDSHISFIEQNNYLEVNAYSKPKV